LRLRIGEVAIGLMDGGRAVALEAEKRRPDWRRGRSGRAIAAWGAAAALILLPFLAMLASL
jgi:hypothetical protein